MVCSYRFVDVSNKDANKELFLLDQEMDKIQMTIKQLQKNLSDLQYDLQLKEGQPPNIYNSIDCEIVWKRSQTEDSQRSTSEDDEDTNTGVNHEGGGDDDDVLDYSTTGTSTPSPATYEHCLLSFLVGNDSSSLAINKDEKTMPSNIKKILPMKRQLLNEKKRMNNTTTTILNNNNKKRRVCMSCGKC